MLTDALLQDRPGGAAVGYRDAAPGSTRRWIARLTSPCQDWEARPRAHRRRTAAACVAAGLALSLLLGFTHVLGSTAKLGKYTDVSAVLGSLYFIAWSVSFYPQVIMNWRRQSVVGMSLDFAVMNLLGFACYSAYNLAFYSDPALRAAYETEKKDHIIIAGSDILFSVHALVLTAVTVWQCVVYPRGKQRVGRGTIAFVAATLVLLVVYACLVGFYVDAKPEGSAAREHAAAKRFFQLQLFTVGVFDARLSWLDFLVFVGYTKAVISLVKYIPQVLLNWRRRSTVGWSVLNVLLDFTGGVFSTAQLFLDAAVCPQPPCAVAGAKLAIGTCSIVFDTIFIVQHYVLYRHNRADPWRRGSSASGADGDDAGALEAAAAAIDDEGRDVLLDGGGEGSAEV